MNNPIFQNIDPSPHNITVYRWERITVVVIQVVVMNIIIQISVFNCFGWPPAVKLRCVFKATTCLNPVCLQNWKIHIFLLGHDIWEVFCCIVLCCTEVSITSVKKRTEDLIKMCSVWLEVFKVHCWETLLLTSAGKWMTVALTSTANCGL